MNRKLQTISTLLKLALIIIFLLLIPTIPVVTLILTTYLIIILDQTPALKILGISILILFPISAIVTYKVCKSIQEDQTEVESYS